MKKIALFSMALLLTGALGIVLLSSFKGGSVEEEKFTMTYFKFDEEADPTEGELELEANWDVVTSVPGSNPCNTGSNAPCIIEIPNSEAGISTLDSDEVKVEKLVAFLEEQPSAQSYVANEEVYIYRRP